MRRIATSIAPDDAPQRITTTPFFKYQHDEVPDSFWKREKIKSPANCGACHTKAETGSFVEREIHIPK
jgi:nitrate/TMAO reductase-like tetraheme cytochrome c subunit